MLDASHVLYLLIITIEYKANHSEEHAPGIGNRFGCDDWLADSYRGTWALAKTASIPDFDRAL